MKKKGPSKESFNLALTICKQLTAQYPGKNDASINEIMNILHAITAQYIATFFDQEQYELACQKTHECLIENLKIISWTGGIAYKKIHECLIENLKRTDSKGEEE